jgi:hypothetical protein
MSHTHTHITPRISGTLRLSKHRRVAPADDPSAQVNLTDAPSNGELELPHEHDEQVGMTGGVTSPRVQQGAHDLKRGIQDTSGAVESNVAYEKLKRS